MSTNLFVSIIIVSFNTKDLLKFCISSIKNISDKYNLQVIVVDNCSTDGSVEMITDNFPFVHLIKNDKNMGFGYANNQAMRLARGDYFFLLNSDAELGMGVLEALLEEAMSHPKIAMVGPRVEYPDGRMQYTAGPSLSIMRFFLRSMGFFLPAWFRSIYREKRAGSVVGLNKTTSVESISAVALLIKKQFFLESGGFDENFFMYVEDVDLGVRACKSGWKIRYVPSVCVIHHDGASSKGLYRDFSPLTLSSMLYFFNKHHGWLGQMQFRFIGVTGSSLRLVVGVGMWLVTLGRLGKAEIVQSLSALGVFLRPLQIIATRR